MSDPLVVSTKKNDRNANFLKEWEEARNTLSGFDAHLHDLRKFGFSFITALLAAESLVLPSRLLDVNIGDTTGILPAETKFAVLLVTLILIVALQFIDRNYQVIQGAASKRAMILEKKLNLELTNTIAQRFRKHRVRDFVNYIYYSFAAGVVVIGGFALGPRSGFFLLLFLVAGIASYAGHYVLEHSVRPPYPLGIIDWTIDPLQCSIGDEVEITLTNLGNEKEPRVFKKNTIMWQIMKEGDNKPLKTERAKQDIPIKARDSYTWLWKAGIGLDKGASTLDEGIYRVYRVTLDKKGNPTEPKPLMVKLRIKRE